MEYVMTGDYLIPEITPEEPGMIGRYSRLRMRYLRENRPLLYNRLIISGKMISHLIETETEAGKRISEMLPKLAENCGATEKMKESDPLKWAGLMNGCLQQAEETVLSEIIYS